jgi:hypothetical protein
MFLTSNQYQYIKPMKTVDFIIIMMAILTVGFITSCSFEPTPDINDNALAEFNSLTPPVRLLAKDITMKCWGVTLIDSKNKAITLGNMTALANQLGASYNIGDTIVKPIGK